MRTVKCPCCGKEVQASEVKYREVCHKVMCGDSTSEEDVRKLMEGEKAAMSFTDPPYGVDYGGHNHPSWSQKHAPIEGDSLKGEELKNHWAIALSTIAPSILGDLYVAAPAGPTQVEMALAIQKTLFEHHQWLIWVKDSLVLGRANYHYRHEHLWYGWKKGEKSSYCAGRDQDSVWEINRPKRSDEHPTMKPIELIAKAIQNSSHSEEIVVDPFLGSGSTIVACEQTQSHRLRNGDRAKIRSGFAPAPCRYGA